MESILYKAIFTPATLNNYCKISKFATIFAVKLLLYTLLNIFIKFREPIIQKYCSMLLNRDLRIENRELYRFTDIIYNTFIVNLQLLTKIHCLKYDFLSPSTEKGKSTKYNFNVHSSLTFLTCTY